MEGKFSRQGYDGKIQGRFRHDLLIGTIGILDLARGRYANPFSG